jgi:hypothetical protein
MSTAVSFGYPDGCTQADHDRAFSESLSEPPDSDPIQADCKHWAEEDSCEWIDGKLLCPACTLAHDSIALKPITARVQLPTRPDSQVA